MICLHLLYGLSLLLNRPWFLLSVVSSASYPGGNLCARCPDECSSLVYFSPCSSDFPWRRLYWGLLGLFVRLSPSSAFMILLCYSPVMVPRFNRLLVSCLNFEGRNLLGAAGADRAKRNKAMIVKIAVPVLPMLLLLLTASAASMTPDDRACLRAFFGSNYFLTICVLSQINVGRLMAREAVLAPTLAARRVLAVGAVACFVELALKLYMILVLYPAAVEDGA
ncbi:hypothetical protein CFC21_022660 [Triticum aestivum]|uniref:Uncharacterized protein n=2 Tax=Triticum aestivum TaxID=4565 RepID=A0A9R1ECY5_WHEAT|nr:hypothetical protein CFC21_022660 [Triticum aestivum]